MPAKDGASDKHDTALALFKDWNQYLLLTAAAAIAWVFGDTLPEPYSLRGLSVAILAISLLFGILTLAMIPLIQEQREGDTSIYECRPEWWLTRAIGWRVRLTTVCLPFHILFFVGVALYTVGSMLSGGS